MAKQTKTLVTFSRKYINEYEHLEKQGNKSNYVAELIRKDMNKDLVNEQLDIGVIKQAIREVLEENQFGVVATKKEKADYSDLVDDLFNI